MKIKFKIFKQLQKEGGGVVSKRQMEKSLSTTLTNNTTGIDTDIFTLNMLNVAPII